MARSVGGAGATGRSARAWGTLGGLWGGVFAGARAIATGDRAQGLRPALKRGSLAAADPDRPGRIRRLAATFRAARRVRWADALCAVALAAAGVAVSWAGSGVIPAAALAEPNINIYFESDIPRVVRNLTDPDSSHHRSTVHPLFSLVGYPSTRAIGLTFGLDRLESVRVFQAASSAILPALLFLFCRGIGLRRPDAGLVTLALLSSAAFIFWTAVPETYTLGAASLMLPLTYLALLPRGRGPGTLGLVAVCAASFSITVTNAVSGALVALLKRGWGAVWILYQAFAAVVILWGIQFTLLPTSRFPLYIFEEQRYVVREVSGILWRWTMTAVNFFAHALVMPDLVLGRADSPARVGLNPQYTLPSADPWSIVALAAWGAALGMGVWGATRLIKERRAVVLAAAGVVAAQLALHLVYGSVTFLYTLHWTPVLLAIAAFGLLGRYKAAARAALVVFVAAAAMNNSARLSEAGAFLDRITAGSRPPNPAWPSSSKTDSSRAAKLEAKLGLRASALEYVGEDPRDLDLWPAGSGTPRVALGPLDPRGKVHIPIGVVNTLDSLKTFVEPEGGFSPGLASYGVSFWAREGGDVVAPTQPGVRVEYGLAPGGLLIPWSAWQAGPVRIRTEICGVAVPTPEGEGVVTAARAHLTNPLAEPRRVSLLVALRALGPAGGRTKQVEIREGAVLVDGRPAVVPMAEPSGAAAFPDDSATDAAYRDALSGTTAATSGKGDASALLRFDLELAPGETKTVGFVCPVLPGRYAVRHRWDGANPLAQLDTAVPGSAEGGILQPDPGLAFYRSLDPGLLFERAAAAGRDLTGRVRINLPDARWAEALAAITGHLGMCLNEGAPDVAVVNYNVFNRDGVYTASVLQKMGRGDLAAAAIDYFIARPFNGRVELEADNPGQVLWIIGEQYRFTRDKAWLDRIYPSVQKLAAMIGYYRTAPGPHYLSPTSLEVASGIPPGHERRILRPGACDGHHPEYTEAFDIAGLRQAIHLARESGRLSDATYWEGLERRLFGSYDRRFARPARLLASGYGSFCVLWPCRLYPLTEGKGREAFADVGPRRPPPDFKSWRYFPLAKSHQSLLAGNRAAGHQTIAAHLDHEQMRGWYVFDEGGPSGRGGWDHINTTWDPNIAMPHGWAIAELALLIRDSIAFEDGDSLVLLAGIPEAWFGRKLEVADLPTHFGSLGFVYEPSAHGGTLTISGEAAAAARIILRLPEGREASVTIAGKPAPRAPGGGVDVTGPGPAVIRFMD